MGKDATKLAAELASLRRLLVAALDRVEQIERETIPLIVEFEITVVRVSEKQG